MTDRDQRRAGESLGALAALPSLTDAPELYRPSPPANDPETRAGARRDRDFALRAAAGATALADRLHGSLPDMAEGLTEEMLRRFDADGARLIDGAPSAAAGEMARAAVGRARGRLADRLLPEEAAARAAARRQGLIDALAQFRAGAQSDPEMADALHAEGAAAIQGAADWLGADEAKMLAGQWRKEIYRGAADGWIVADPAGAARMLSAGAYGDALSRDLRRGLVDQARSRAAALAQDRVETMAARAQEDGLARERKRQAFLIDYAGRIETGTARATELQEADAAGVIMAGDRETLERRRAERNAEQAAQADVLARVGRFFGGLRDRIPSLDDFAAYFDKAVGPLTLVTPAEFHDEIARTYLRNVDAQLPDDRSQLLPPPIRARIDPEEIYRMVDFQEEGRTDFELALRHPTLGRLVKDAASRAKTATAEAFKTGGHNDSADAFRHAYWNFLLTREFGPKIAKMFADAHERIASAQAAEHERVMDLYNNARGRALATAPESRGRDGRDVVMEALRSGLLQVEPFE